MKNTQEEVPKVRSIRTVNKNSKQVLNPQNQRPSRRDQQKKIEEAEKKKGLEEQEAEEIQKLAEDNLRRKKNGTAKFCNKCNKSIEEQAVSQGEDMNYHPDCFICEKCQKGLAGEQFVPHKGKGYHLGC